MKGVKLTKNEQWGLLGVGLILISLVLILYAKNQWSYIVLAGDNQIPIDSVNVSVLQKFDKEAVRFNVDEKKVVKKNYSVVKIVAPQSFDPNSVDSAFWVKLGFDRNLAGRIVKFKNACNGFDKQGDLLKVYGLKPEYFDAIKDSLIFKKVTVCLNGASDAEFQKIKGIGRVLSKRIISYRKLLKGFYKVDQLNEVYGLDLSLVDTSRYQLTTCRGNTRFIKQGVSFNDLSSHPYISRTAAKKIIKLLSLQSSIQHADLAEVLPDSTALKLKYYLHE